MHTKCIIYANVFSGYPANKYSIGHFLTIYHWMLSGWITNAAFIAMSKLESVWAVLIMSSLDVMYTNAAFMLISSVDILQGNTVLDIFCTMSALNDV